MSKFPRVFADKLDIPRDDPFLESSIESAATSKVVRRLQKNPIAGNYDLPHMQEIHRQLFGKISTLAGVVRDYGMLKGETNFSPPEDIYRLFEFELPKDKARVIELQSNLPDYVNNVAVLHSTLDDAHPF